MVGLTAEGISKAVVADIYHKIEILSTDRLANDSLGFSGTETGNLGFDNIRVFFIKCFLSFTLNLREFLLIVALRYIIEILLSRLGN